MLTKPQAQLLCETHEVYQLFDDSKEVQLLEDNNPELLDAYYALMQMASD